MMWRASVCLLVLLLGCTTSPKDDAAGPYLRLADADDVPTLDPARGYDNISWQFEAMLFNTLVDYDADGNLIGELATDWEISDDHLTYTFRLRHDARFTNGRALVADDVRYAVERALNPHTRSQGAEFFRGIRGAEECAAAHCRVAGIEVPDPYTLRFQLRQFDPLFLHKLAMPFAAAVPAEEVERWGEDFGRHPVGSGPFVLSEWAPGQRLLLRRNPEYFLPGVPRLAGVLRLVGVTDELAWMKYDADQLDVVASIPPPEFARLVHDAHYQPLLHHVTTMRTQYVGMNCRMKPFTDPRVRQAMNFAVNKVKLLRLVNNRGVVAKGFLPPNMPGYNPNVPGYPFDPERAKRLLAEAGYPDGFATTLWVRSADDALRLAQAIQQDLASVQVRVRIKPIAWGPFLEAVRAPDLVAMFLLGWEADFPDPSNFLEVLLHSKYIGSNNDTFYSNPEVDRLLDTAARTVDTEMRMQLLRTVELRAIEDAPWVFLYHPVTYEIVQPRVRGFQLHALRPPRFDRVWLADAASRTAPAPTAAP